MRNMKPRAVVFEEPGRLALNQVSLTQPGPEDYVVDIDFSGISTGTERLLWNGRMPQFPGMGYPLVPGYESVGRIVESGADCPLTPGEHVFVPGSRCFTDVRGLFGGASARVVVSSDRVTPIGAEFGQEGILLALAATAYHAANADAHDGLPDLVVGHGVLGRLMSRVIAALGGKPLTVWETNPERRPGGGSYAVLNSTDDPWHDYRLICDVSGDGTLLDELVSRLAPGGGIILAGFYEKPLSFSFPAAFMREARLCVAAEWEQSDLVAVTDLVRTGRLSLDGLITHTSEATRADTAYRTAFEDTDCLKMILDWRCCQ
jgi:3-hydroxyethyl bacteriochlorophyllide a dehydrogenase